jgi:thiosulfate reductase cytochrome b subunit
MVLIGPALWSTGIVYLAYPLWANWAIGTIGLPAVAFVHTAAAFLMVTFVIIHVYMTTTGKTVTHYVETMITGYETIELTAAEAAYLEEDQPGVLKK